MAEVEKEVIKDLVKAPEYSGAFFVPCSHDIILLNRINWRSDGISKTWQDRPES